MGLSVPPGPPRALPCDDLMLSNGALSSARPTACLALEILEILLELHANRRSFATGHRQGQGAHDHIFTCSLDDLSRFPSRPRPSPSPLHLHFGADRRQHLSAS